MNNKQIIERISQLANDPLGIIFVAEYPTANGVVRWDGTVCYRRNGEKYFTFGIEPSEFLERCRTMRAADLLTGSAKLACVAQSANR